MTTGIPEKKPANWLRNVTAKGLLMASSLGANAITLAPPALMMAGTLPMNDPRAPADVRLGGALLLAVSLILLDLKSGKKLGYTHQIIKAIKKVPGLENADEGTVLGSLCLAACATLGTGAVGEMAAGNSYSGGLKLAINTLNYPAGAFFALQTTRKKLEKYFGKEIRLNHMDGDGQVRIPENPILIPDLLQQMAFLSAAVGIYVYGEMKVDAARFTGIMFMLSNGIAAADLMSKPFRGEWHSELELLAKDITAHDPDAPMNEALLERMKAVYTKHVDSDSSEKILVNQHLLVAAIEPVLAKITKPAPQKSL